MSSPVVCTHANQLSLTTSLPLLSHGSTSSRVVAVEGRWEGERAGGREGGREQGVGRGYRREGGGKGKMGVIRMEQQRQ